MNDALIKPDDILIRPLTEADSLEDLTALLHRAYKALADMGLRYLATHQSVDVTRHRVNRGTCFVAVYEKRIAGTITCYDSDHTRGSPWMDKPGVGHLGQMAVEPELQGRGLGTRLMQHAEAHARKVGVEALALDTAEQAEHLISWYRRLGYSFIEYANWDVTNYRSVVLGKRLSEVEP